MTKHFILISVVFLFNCFAFADSTYTTSTGSIFMRAQGPGNFGMAWKAPNGTIWSSDQGLMMSEGWQGYSIPFTAPSQACANLGGSLPSRDDFINLISFFDYKIVPLFVWQVNQTVNQLILTDQGVKDFVAIFPDLKSEPYKYFWSSSNAISGTENGYRPVAFCAAGGNILAYSWIDREGISEHVRCISH